MKKTKESILAALAVMVLPGACTLEPGEDIFKHGNEVTVQISVKDDFRIGNLTRSSLGSGVEDICTGTVIGIYQHSDGRLLHTAVIPTSETAHSISLPKGSYDIRALSNLKAISPEGEVEDLCMPELLSTADSLCYRLGGTSLDSRMVNGSGDGFRSETFSELTQYGIPRAGRMDGLRLEADTGLEIPVKALLAKLTVNVEHPGVDRSITDRSISARQVNRTLMPFRDSSRAMGPEDIMECGDYEPVVSNALNTTYILYLTENAQGRLLPENGDPTAKNPDSISETAGTDVASLCSYIELGTEIGAGVDMSAYGGYGGHVTYRFYPGGDSTGDFSIIRNREYNVNLRLTVNGIFAGGWKSGQESDFSDGREFGFSRADVQDIACDGQMFTENDVLAVRKNRPGSCYVWFNRMDDIDWTVNHGAEHVNWDHSPSDIRTTSWSSDFLAPETSYYDTPMYFELQSCGISPHYDNATHKLTFTVTDPSKFIPGKEFILSAWMIPGGKERKTTLRLKTYDDIEVYERDGLNLTTGFYTGMKRTLQIRGLAGETVSYTFSQSGGISPQPSLYWPYQAGTVYTKSSEELADEDGKFSGIPLYGFSTGGSSRIEFSSSDPYNDEVRSIAVTVRKPYYNPPESSICWVPIDGSTVNYNAEGPWTDLLGNVIATDRFDKENYDVWLGLEAVSGTDGSNADYVWRDNSTVYMRHITLDGIKHMQARPKNPQMGTGSCTITFTPGVPDFDSGPGVPAFKDSVFDDRGLRGRPLSPYFADMRLPVTLEQEARVNFHGNDPGRMEISFEESADDWQNGSWTCDASTGTIKWRWCNLDERGLFICNHVPSGRRTAELTFTNIHSGEQYSIQKGWEYDFYAKLGCYVVFRTDSPLAYVFVCTGKEYQNLDRYVKEYGFLPTRLDLGMINGLDYSRLLSWRSYFVNGPVGGNMQTLDSREYRSHAFPSGSTTWSRILINEIMSTGIYDPPHNISEQAIIGGAWNANNPCQLGDGIYLYPDSGGLDMWGYRIIH